MSEELIRCTTKGCNKILASKAPATKVSTGFVHLICPRCNADVYIAPEPATLPEPETRQHAA